MLEQDDFKTSETLTEFNKAFFAFSKLELGVTKDAKNPFFKSTYASLPNVLHSTREKLVEHGFYIMQLPLGGVGIHKLLNRITHKSGEYVQWIYSSPVAKSDPQGYAAATTYGRRTNITSSLGLPEEDDDGNQASTKQAPPKRVFDKDPDKDYVVGKSQVEHGIVIIGGNKAHGNRYTATPEQKILLRDIAKEFGINSTESLKNMSGALIGTPLDKMKERIKEFVAEDYS